MGGQRRGNCPCGGVHAPINIVFIGHQVIIGALVFTGEAISLFYGVDVGTKIALEIRERLFDDFDLQTIGVLHLESEVLQLLLLLGIQRLADTHIVLDQLISRQQRIQFTCDAGCNT